MSSCVHDLNLDSNCHLSFFDFITFPTEVIVIFGDKSPLGSSWVLLTCKLDTCNSGNGMMSGLFSSFDSQYSPTDLSPAIHIYGLSASPRSKVQFASIKNPTHKPRNRIVTELKRRPVQGYNGLTPHYRRLESIFSIPPDAASRSPQRHRLISMHTKLTPLNTHPDHVPHIEAAVKPRLRLHRYFRRSREQDRAPQRPSVLLSTNIAIPATALDLKTVLSPVMRIR